MMVGIIDADQSGTVSKEEFVHFVVQMAEGVRPVLLMELRYQTDTTLTRLSELTKKLESNQERMIEILADINATKHHVEFKSILQEVISSQQEEKHSIMEGL